MYYHLNEYTYKNKSQVLYSSGTKQKYFIPPCIWEFDHNSTVTKKIIISFWFSLFFSVFNTTYLSYLKENIYSLALWFKTQIKYEIKRYPKALKRW